MKNRIVKKFIAGVLALALVFSLTACGTSGSKKDDKKVTVGVCAGPYGDMFEDCIKPSLNKLGYEVEIIEISDIVTPNTAVDEGEITYGSIIASTETGAIVFPRMTAAINAQIAPEVFSIGSEIDSSINLIPKKENAIERI